jgi:hypothetical protein
VASHLEPAAVGLPAQSQTAHRVALGICPDDCKDPEPRPSPCPSIQALQPRPEPAAPIDWDDARGISQGDLTNEWRLRPING